MYGSSSPGGTTNTKLVELNITTTNPRYGVQNFGRLYYIGYNIGQIKINRYPWR